MNNKKGLTLVELMVSMAIMGTATAMVLTGSIALSKGIFRPRKMVQGRREMVEFCAGFYNFVNHSFSAFLVDSSLTTEPPELDYLNTNFTDADPRQDILYLVKDENGTEGRLVYDSDPDSDSSTPGGAFIWYKNTGATAQVMLEDVYRIDTIWDSNGDPVLTGTNAPVQPIFRFPHKSFLYNGDEGLPNRPKLVTVQFRKVIVPKGFETPTPISIPMTVSAEVNVSTYEDN